MLSMRIPRRGYPEGRKQRRKREGGEAIAMKS